MIYMSNNGVCLCDKHVGQGGAYLQAEVEQPNNTCSTRSTQDGVEIITTPLDTWLCLTHEVARQEDVECDACN
jgi:hypothetical protein